MHKEKLVKEIRTLHWRVYRDLILEAVNKNIAIPEEDLIWAILEIPEHYKISSLIHYSNNLMPISKNSIELIQACITKENTRANNNTANSYSEHLNELLSKVKII